MRNATAVGLAGVATAALALSLTGATAGSAAATGDQAVGLTTSGGMVGFSTSDPSRLTTIGKPVGLAGDTKLVGIDHRPATGDLYGLGDAGGVYTLDGSTATKVATLSVTLEGTAFDIDFNPTVDRLRVVSNTGQNLRVDVSTGAATVDGSLNYTAGTDATGISGAAYTNNDVDPNTATSLFDIDTALDQVVLQSPANSGQLAATGKLLLDAGTDVGLDIVSGLSNGTAVSNRAYAVLSADGGYGLYRIIPLTGEAQKMGDFPAPRQVFDIALAPK